MRFVNLGALSALRTGKRRLAAATSMAMIAGTFALVSAPAASAETAAPITFEPSTYMPGDINGQDGWSKTGPFDAAVSANTYGFTSLATQSLRISNAVTSGSFGDQTVSKPLLNEAGEAGAANGGMSSGVRQSHFDASFDFASTTIIDQTMSMSVSPDRGDGARMSYLRFVDQADGIHVFFDDYVDAVPYGAIGTETDGCGLEDDFRDVDIATLDREETHTIRFSMDFVDGPRNDVVKIYIDGALKGAGTSWEDYFRWCENSGTSRTVDSLLFRTAGTAVPANANNGFLFDSLLLESSMTDTLGDCLVLVTPGTPTVYTLLADCITDQTIVVPQNVGGSTFDGNGFSITGVDPDGGHFLGAVVQAQAGSDAITVENLTVKTDNLSDACDAGADRLRGILFEGVSGAITNNTVTDLEQGTGGTSGCQEGNAIDVRNTANVTPRPNVTISANDVSDYQKTGIIATLSTVTTITNNTITGDGPINYIAENGIQVSFKATAKLVGNDVSLNNYSPRKVSACGLLIYKAGGVSGATKTGLAYVKADNNFHNNEVNVCNFGKGGTFSPDA